MNIRSILIDNFKKFNYGEKQTFNFSSFKDGKPFIFVAPNGYGKTTISSALNIAGGNADLNKKDLPNQFEAMKVSISTDNGTFLFNSLKDNNEIKNNFNIKLINKNIKPSTNNFNLHGHNVTIPKIEISDMPLIKINKNQKIKYDVIEIRKKYRRTTIKNLFIDISFLFDDIMFLKILKENFSLFCSKKFSKFVNDIEGILFNADSNAKSDINIIKKEIAEYSVLSLTGYKNIIEFLDAKYASAFEKNIILFQISTMSLSKDILSKSIESILWNDDYKYVIKLIDIFNYNKRCVIKKEKDWYVLCFPDYKNISNGERDILAIIAELLPMLLHGNSSSKKYTFLIFDQIFDYLDGSNLFAFQYLLTLIVERFKHINKKLFILLFTHLDPNIFNTFSFSYNSEYFCYEFKKLISPENDAYMNILKDRDNKAFNIDLATYYLHYSPKKFVTPSTFPSEFRKIFLDNLAFYDFLNNNKKSFLLNENYNPFAVVLFLRVFSELKMYNLISNDDLKNTFLDLTSGQKINLLRKNGIYVPLDVHLFYTFYNAALHNVNDTYEKTLIIFLSSTVVQKIIDEFIGDSNLPNS